MKGKLRTFVWQRTNYQINLHELQHPDISLPASAFPHLTATSLHTNSKWWQGLFPTVPPATCWPSYALPAPLLSDKTSLLICWISFVSYSCYLHWSKSGFDLISSISIWQGWKEVHSCDTLYLIDRVVVFFVPVVFLATKPIPFGVLFKHSTTPPWRIPLVHALHCFS